MEHIRQMPEESMSVPIEHFEEDGGGGEGDRRLRPLLTGVLLLIVVSGTVDLVLDAPDTWWSFHVLYELALILGGLATTAVLWTRWARAERSLSTTRRALHERQAERDARLRTGASTDERARLKDLERENRQLRRANEILRKTYDTMPLSEPYPRITMPEANYVLCGYFALPFG